MSSAWRRWRIRVTNIRSDDDQRGPQWHGYSLQYAYCPQDGCDHAATAETLAKAKTLACTEHRHGIRCSPVGGPR